MSDTWFAIANDARKAAHSLKHLHYRSSINRAYYAAYSYITHSLSQLPNMTFAGNDEGPKHPGRTGRGGIRRLIDTTLRIDDLQKRQAVSELIGRLYTLRCWADYRPSHEILSKDAWEAISIMQKIFKIV